MRLVRHVGGAITGGSIRFRPESGPPIDLVRAPEDRLRQIRGNDIAMIFQEPMTSLNPVFTIGNQIVEALVLHQHLGLREARREAEALLRRVRLPDAGAMLGRYPHQLSGGMRQRVMIAMALCCRPRLLIADEPTTALDVTIQAQILTLIRELQRDLGMAVLFITHDMGVVAEMADEVLVMWRGRKVEQAPVRDIFRAPQHPYTRALLSAVPRLGSLAGEDLPKRTPLIVLDGDTPRSVGETRVQDTADTSAPLLSVDRLSTWFDLKKDVFGRPTHRCHAVQQVSFEVYPGETLALVGRIRQRQVDHRQDPAAAGETDLGQHPLRRAGRAGDGGGGPAAAAPEDPVCVPGPLRRARPAQEGRILDRRADRHPWAGGGPRGGDPAGA